MKIKKIEKIKFKGDVYNLELESKIKEDDLFWVEATTNIITHNCLPKEVNALIYEYGQYSLDPLMLKAAWEKNLKVRK